MEGQKSNPFGELRVNLTEFEMVYNLLVSGRIHERHRFVAGNALLPVNRKTLHAAIGLILIFCAVFPLVEPILGWNNNIFVTGHDTESTLALVILLLELVLALAGALVFLLAVFRVIERILEKSLLLTSESGFRIAVPDLSPPVPLRI